jgi:hypothetical protein
MPSGSIGEKVIYVIGWNRVYIVPSFSIENNVHLWKGFKIKSL